MKFWVIFVISLSLSGCGSEPVPVEEATSEVEIENLYQWKFREGLFPVEELNEREIVRRIRKNILAKQEKNTAKSFENYSEIIPETGVEFEMIAIEGGTFLMGSAESDPDQLEDEGPQHKVQLSPFWMGKFEISWAEFEPFMISDVRRTPTGYPTQEDRSGRIVDWTSSPSTPYLDMSFEMGNGPRFPAICMTHHAASKYCQWLSAQTGDFYRLPTEAEWEYACRAGTTGPFHCKTEDLEEFAIIDPELIRTGYAKIGSRKPNPWGLYDMHGNVFEWTLDGYDAEAYQKRVDSGEAIINPWVRPTQRYPRVARGGSWYDPAPECRSARRLFSVPEWQIQDPMLPKSLWYLTDAQWLGFRIVRSDEIPSEEDLYEIWNSGNIHHKETDIVPKNLHY